MNTITFKEINSGETSNITFSPNLWDASHHAVESADFTVSDSGELIADKATIDWWWEFIRDMEKAEKRKHEIIVKADEKDRDDIIYEYSEAVASCDFEDIPRVLNRVSDMYTIPQTLKESEERLQATMESMGLD